MAEGRRSSQRYLSGRSKIIGFSGLSTDRHLYVESGQVEPNLGFPGEKSLPVSSTYYKLITVPNGSTYDRYWQEDTPATLVNGITIFDEGTLVGTANTVSKLNFVGAAVTATASGTISTITVTPVSISTLAPPNARSGDLWWDSDEGELNVYYQDVDSAQWVLANSGIGTTTGGGGGGGGGGSGGANVTVSSNPPTSPTPSNGDLWWDSDIGELYIYYADGDSNQWVETSGGSETVTISDNAPPNPNDGDLWWESDTGSLKLYYNDGDSQQWVDANAGVLSALSVWETNSSGIHTSVNVGIGTTNVSAVDSSNTAVLAVGIVTAYKYYGDGSNLTGVPGSAGAQGDVGAQGAQGATGGAQGAVGAQGAQGAGGPGAQGAQGHQGHQGQTGSGSAGAQGNQGNAGAQGAQGNNGAQGAQGQDGTAASQGAQGNQGHQGSQGNIGAQGAQGQDGTAASQGAQGNQGHQGAQGQTGSGSAGAQGNQGHQGNNGAQGAQGNNGAQGAQGVTGARSYTVTNNGASNYVIDGASNPTLNLLRGFTYIFNMNAAGHGFGIQTVSGTWTGSNAYTTGITNAGAATGTIIFAVPYNAPSTLYYACTSQHSGMVGTISISNVGPTGAQGAQGNNGAQGNQGHQGAQGQTGSGSAGAQGNQGYQGNNGAQGAQGNTGPSSSRSTNSRTTTSLAQTAYQDMVLTTAGKTCALLKVQISAPAWVILYVDAASRTSDAAGTGSGRSEGTDPTPGSGVLAEVSTTTSGASTFLMSPGLIAWNNDSTPAAQIYARVYNKRATSGSNTITVTLTTVKLEA